MASKVYVLTDEDARITRVEGGYTMSNIQDVAQWTQVAEGEGDRYNLCQSHYLPNGLMDGRGIYRYKLVEDTSSPYGVRIVERTKAEMDADYVPPEPAPDLAEKVAGLEEKNRQLEEALELLLSGETEVQDVT